MFVLILGGSRPQFSAVQACQELSYDFMVFDGNSNCFATNFINQDQFREVNISNKRDVMDALTKLPRKVDGCVSTQTDVAIETQAFVNKELNLIGIKPKHIPMVLDKYEMSLACFKAGILHPKTILYNNIEDIFKEFSNKKIVVKPADSSGSKGVFIIDLMDKSFKVKLDQALKESIIYSPSKKILIQEFIEGLEVGAQYFHLRNMNSPFIMHDDQLGGPHSNVPIGHSMPCEIHSSLIEQSKKTIENFLTFNNLPQGPYNIDFIIKDNKVYLIEIGARVGATCLQEMTYEHLGFNLIKEQIKLICGKPVSVKLKQNPLPVASRMVFSKKVGICEKIDLPDLHKIEQKMNVTFEEFKIDIKKGDKLKGFNSGRDRLGFMVVSSDKIQNCFNAINRAYDEIKIN